MRGLLLEPISNQEVAELIQLADKEALIYIIILLGHYYKDRAFSQQMLLKLAEHEDAWIRCLACQGFGHLARMHGYVDKRLVKPVLLRELRKTPNAGSIQTALDDINHFLKWNLGQKKRFSPTVRQAYKAYRRHANSDTGRRSRPLNRMRSIPYTGASGAPEQRPLGALNLSTAQP